jgi:hypothetical protein
VRGYRPPSMPSSGMRRALPWVTVGLLILGVGAGAGLGIAGQSPTPGPLTATGQISRIVAATRQARTARFTYSSNNTSTNRLLRGSTRGSGEVNFSRHVMRTVERDRSIGFSGTSAATEKPVVQDNDMEDVWIGRTQYTRIEFDNDPHSPWLKGPTWPKDSFGPLGALGFVDPLGQLSADEGVPGLRIEAAGSATVHGVETTQYRLVMPTCGASTRSDGLTESIAPLQLWVDGHGRLVQARESITEDIAKDAHLGTAFAGEDFPTGRVTSVGIIDLGHFGAPAAIAAPPVEITHATSGGSFIEAKRGPCR